MEPTKTEVVVVGAGPGGYAAAFYAADETASRQIECSQTDLYTSFFLLRLFPNLDFAKRDARFALSHI